tara:strand:- start:545 stop:772 length:228 start_codon:yes stop_codon:yes gene_type:complete
MTNKTNPTEVLKFFRKAKMKRMQEGGEPGFFSLKKRRERNKRKEKKAEEAGNYDRSDKLVGRRRRFTKRVLDRRG